MMRVALDQEQEEIQFLAHVTHLSDMFLLAQLNHECPPPKVVVVPDTQTDISQIPLRLLMDAAITLLEEPTEDYPLKNEKTTFYICHGHSCLPPTNDPPVNEGIGSRER